MKREGTARDSMILELRGQYFSMSEIARRLGCSVGTVHRVIKSAESPQEVRKDP